MGGACRGSVEASAVAGKLFVGFNLLSPSCIVAPLSFFSPRYRLAVRSVDGEQSFDGVGGVGDVT